MKLLNKTKQLKGFTIVELLIVVVVIGILAAITIVSFSGITSQANVASVKSDLDSNSRKLQLYYTQYGSYPTALDGSNCPSAPTVDSNYCLKLSPGNTVSAYTGAQSTFSLTIAKGASIVYKITPDAGPTIVSFNSATGGTTATFISNGKQYRSHTFTAGTSNFIVSKADQPFEVLLVGGGGSGGGSSVMFTTVGGGGGGGALLYGTMGVSPNGPARLLTPTTYPVVVGAGAGAGSYSGNNGGDSTFDGLTALGGGGGSGEWSRSGKNGGSGGGCWIGEATTGAGAGTSGQGGAGGYNQSGASGGSALHMPVTIRGTSESFGIGAAVSGWGSSPSNLGSGGIGVWMQQYGESGKGGIAVITYEIAL